MGMRNAIFMKDTIQIDGQVTHGGSRKKKREKFQIINLEIES